jgi:GrpB-like predicted nucleotidyltransferase (UPF0157 family)
MSETQDNHSAIIGGPVKLTQKIEISPYDPNWPEKYESHRRRIIEALGDKALQLEHTGSTSVPGLDAKPVIDITLVLQNSADEDQYVPNLQNAGYILTVREPDWFEHRMFKSGNQDVNLHVFSEGSTEIQKVISFRDWLRYNPHDRDYYAKTKIVLAENDWQYIQEYADAKSDVILEILGRALASK